MAGGTNSFEQKCDRFAPDTWAVNTHSGYFKLYYICNINGELENDQEEVTTDTSKNTRSNEDVTMVIYKSSKTVKFIPNSLFDTFVNLEYVLIHFTNKFETMKREYLRNAHNLKSLKVYGNPIKKIDANVFAEAKNLKNINFCNNHIELIHKEAFNGLPNLREVYLFENNIKKLHPQTFSSIATLNLLDLSGNETCVNEKFTSVDRRFPEIEGKISTRCSYEIPDEVTVEDESLKQANDKISILTAETQANQEKIKEMTSKLEEMKAEIRRQQEKHVKEFADQQKEYDANIAGINLQNKAELATQMEAKTNQMEVKLTAQKLELVQECKSVALLEIAKHSFEEGKLSGQMMTLQNVYLALVNSINDQKNILQLVQERLTNLEKKDG